jgi:hypothetical protein
MERIELLCEMFARVHPLPPAAHAGNVKAPTRLIIAGPG